MSIMTQQNPQWRLIGILFIGVLAVSMAAIFIRLAQGAGAGSLVIAAVRLSVAGIILTPIVLRRYQPEIQQLKRTQWGLMALSGVVLGLHFATWISSLEYTSVVNSVVIVTTNPLWVALLSPFLLKEKLSPQILLGLAVAFGGGILVAVSGTSGAPPTRSDPLLGNGLALIGAIAAAIYFIIGRKIQGNNLSIVAYIWIVYSIAALTLLILVVLSGQAFFGLAAEAYFWMILMGLIPQLIGHSAFNYALRFLPAAFVSLVVLGEPIGSGILAFIFLGEAPSLLQLMGAGLILTGIVVASRIQPALEAEIPVTSAP